MRPGERIGPWIVRRPLGRGSMGVVLHVAHAETGAELALKLVAAEVAADPDARARFEREMQAIARVDGHPGIVRVHSAGATPDGRPYYLMDLVEGRSLKDALDAGLGLDAALDAVAQVGAALEHAHGRGLVHRDVKPENIMLTASGQARLTDFGLARAARTADRLTRAGDLVGTPTHMAPEQAVPTLGDVGPWTDVYSLGVVLYEVLTGGRTPYTGASAIEVYTQLYEGHAYPRPGAVTPGVDPALEAVCLKALARNPADRHPTAGAFIEDLARARARGAGRAARSRLLVPALAVLAAGAVGLAALAVVGGRARQEAEARRAAAARFEAAVAQVEALVAREAHAAALEEGGAVRAGAPADAARAVAERLERALVAARRAAVNAAWRAGHLDEARRWLGDARDAHAVPEAALVLALTGDARAALAAGEALDPADRARVAAWAGDRAACEAALAAVEPPERARALRWALRAAAPDLPPPEVDDAATAGGAGWAAAARGEAALAQGQATLAALAFAEAQAGEPALDAALALGLARAHLARGDARAAAAACARALRAAGEAPLERARALGWALWTAVALGPAAGDLQALEAAAGGPLPARARALAPGAPEVRAALAVFEGAGAGPGAGAGAAAGADPGAGARAVAPGPASAADAAGAVARERAAGARGQDGPVGLLVARALDLATLAERARDVEAGRRAADLAAVARRLRPGSAAACVAEARAALAQAALDPAGAAARARAAADEALARAPRDAEALRLRAEALAAALVPDALAADLARARGAADARADAALAVAQAEVAAAFEAALAAAEVAAAGPGAAAGAATTPGDDEAPADLARLGLGRALVEQARRRAAASSDDGAGDPELVAPIRRQLAADLDRALGPLLARVGAPGARAGLADVAAARSALVAAVEADAADPEGGAAAGVEQAEDALAAAAGPRPPRAVLEALLLRAAADDGDGPALQAFLALAGDVPARAVIAARAEDQRPERARRLDPGVPALAVTRALEGAVAGQAAAFRALAEALAQDPQPLLAVLEALSRVERDDASRRALDEALALPGPAGAAPAELVGRALAWRAARAFTPGDDPVTERREAAEHDRGARRATAALTRALQAAPSDPAARLLRALCASSLGRGAAREAEVDPIVAADVADDLRAARAAAPWASAPRLAALGVGPLDAPLRLADELLALGHFGAGHVDVLARVTPGRRAATRPAFEPFEAAARAGRDVRLWDADDTYRQAQRFDGSLPRLALALRLQAAAEHPSDRDPYDGRDGVAALLAALAPDEAGVAAMASACWAAHRAARDRDRRGAALEAALRAAALLPPGLAAADARVVACRVGPPPPPALPGKPQLWRTWTGLRRPSTALEVLAGAARRRDPRRPFDGAFDPWGRTWALLVGVQAGRPWARDELRDDGHLAEAVLALDRADALRPDVPVEEAWYWSLLWGLRWEVDADRPEAARALRAHALAAARRAVAAVPTPTLRALAADLLLDVARLDVADPARAEALARRAREQAEAVAPGDISEDLESGATAWWRLVRHRAAAGDADGARAALREVEARVDEDDDWWFSDYVRREPLAERLRQVLEVAAFLDRRARRD